MASARVPMNPVIQNALIVLTAGLVSSLLCVKVYGAPLSVNAQSAASMPSQAALPATDNSLIQALLRPQGPIAGTAPESNGKR
jgi:hypothetical protein